MFTVQIDNTPSLSTNSQLRVYDINQSKTKDSGDISSAFATFGGSKITTLSVKYAQIKKDLIKCPEALMACWLRLKRALQEDIGEIKSLGEKPIPQLNSVILIT